MSTQRSGTHAMSEDEEYEGDAQLFDGVRNDVVKSYVPTVDFAAIPQINQSFQTLNDAKAYYVAYSGLAGFSVRERSDRKNKSGEVILKIFVCYKEGTKNTRYQEKFKHIVERTGVCERGDVRCKCFARMSVSWKNKEKLWRVSTFIENHNHPPTSPNKVHALRGHRNVTPAVKCLAKEFRDANLRTSDLRRVLETDVGSPDQIGCLEKDLYNNAAKLKNMVSGHDADTLIDHFDTEKTSDENFYFAYETNSDNVLERCYWSDAIARNSYGCFPEVVVFHSTFDTNKYDMYFCPFVGVNNHMQSTVFGCGLLSHQNIESFTWLFTQFLKSMPKNLHPKMFLTDQDAAIGATICDVFPNIIHRLCLWHILAKFPEKINVAVHGDDKTKLVSAIMESDDPDEFESRWSELMSTTTLSQNKWINEMYSIRNMWVPAFLKHIFSAGMTSSQRAESNHNFFKKYLSSDCSLNDVYTRCKNAVKRQRHKELLLDHADKNEKPSLNSSQPMERQMSTRYTRIIFKKFQKQLKVLPEYISSIIEEDATTCFHAVSPFEGSRLRDKTRRVTHDLDSNYISCSCRKFENVGIPCRHILYVMQLKQIKLLPEAYILYRWTQKARSEMAFEAMPSLTTEGPGFLDRSRGLFEKCRSIIQLAALSEQSTLKLNQIFQEAEVLLMQQNELVDGNKQQVITLTDCRDEPLVADPLTTRVRRAHKRLLSMREKAINSGGKHCGICGKIGHNSRTCPDRERNASYQPSPLSNVIMANDNYIADISSAQISGGNSSWFTFF